MISHPIDEFLVSLVGIFAALLWLRPGKYEAVRYGLILAPAGVLYALLMQYAQGGQYHVLLHVKHSAAVLLYLLGVYMLQCPWRRVILSSGVYSLVCSMVGLVIAAVDVPQVPLFLRMTGSVILEYAWLWLFIWLCSRKSGQGGKWLLLLTAGAYFTLCGMVVSNLRGLGIPGDVIFYLHSLISLLSLLLVLHYVLQQAWKRCLVTSFLYITPTVLSHILLWYSVSNIEVH